MVDFAGWQMPVQYESIAKEHLATRTGVGLFDISHMGRLRFAGRDVVPFLDHVLTRKVRTLRGGQIRYALVTNESGGILDDVLIYALSVGDAIDYRLVVNASNREKLLAWFAQHRGGFDVEIIDETTGTGMLAIQGPHAISLAQQVLDEIGLGELRLGEFKYYSGVLVDSAQGLVVVSRTGYTGEDGCEWSLPADRIESCWQRLVELGATPAGLGARDTLRLEAAMPLYGHEIDESIHPFEAGLGFAVQLQDHEFVGSDTLAALAERPVERVRIGLRASGRRVPRQHCAILQSGAAESREVVGEVTSGTFSPTLEVPIAMAYVRPDLAEIGNRLVVDVRGRNVEVEVVPLPFYRRPKG